MNIKVGDSLNIKGKHLDVEMAIPVKDSEWTTDGQTIFILGGWGSSEAYLDYELSQMIADGTALLAIK